MSKDNVQIIDRDNCNFIITQLDISVINIILNKHSKTMGSLLQKGDEGIVRFKNHRCSRQSLHLHILLINNISKN
jgi:hypothetical protein